MPTEPDTPMAPAVRCVIASTIGCATMLGCLILLLPCYKSEKLLAGSLAFSASVMLYIALTELMEEGFESLKDHFQPSQSTTGQDYHKQPDEELKKKWSTGLLKLLQGGYFFGAVLVAIGLDYLLHFLEECAERRKEEKEEAIVDEEEQLQRLMDQSGEEPEKGWLDSNGGTAFEDEVLSRERVIQDVVQRHSDSGKRRCSHENGRTSYFEAVSRLSCEESKRKEDDKRMAHVSWMTFMVISLHNVPEGLVTYFMLGNNASVAVAMGIHNVPEGMAVAIPAFLATRSIWRAVLGTFLSSMGSVLGSLIGLIAQLSASKDANNSGSNSFMSKHVEGAFSIASAGFMCTIAVMELLPEAYYRLTKASKDNTKEEPSNTVIPFTMLIGMFVMQTCVTVVKFLEGDDH